MLWPALTIVMLDQITKRAIVHSLQVFESVPVVTGFFSLVHVRNRGMAFGLMNRPDIGFASYFLLVASLVAVVLILLWFFKLKEDDNRLTLGLSLILAGALGNLVEAKEHCLESLAIRRELNDSWGVATCLDRLGSVMCGLYEYQEAEVVCQESLEIKRAIGDRRG